jgi:cytochrome d ubiquinol oxidase subunit I
MDIILLSRIQFAVTIMFHYLFPPLTIGMGIVLVYLQYRYYRTDDPLYLQAAQFWTKIYGLNFAMGVATGIVMEFQFGTNWANYSRFVGDVFGSALAAEGIFAFFLESGFFALLLFGWGRISKGLHLFATLMVALGSVFSSVWIVIANSWQQTPAGHHIVPVMRNGLPWIVDGKPMMRAEIVDFWQMVFNPSSMTRLSHVLLGCFLMGAYFIMSISAWYILKSRHLEFARRSFLGALTLATISSYLVLFNGHHQAKLVYRYQPAKLATFEGHFHSGPGDLTLFGIPDDAAGVLRYPLRVPGGLSYLLFADTSRDVVGLDKFRPEDRPPLLIPFLSWRVMIGFGTFSILLCSLACYLRWRRTLFDRRWLMWVFVFSVLGAFAANEAGWVTAEVGRQPWIVYPPVHWTAEGNIVTAEDGLVRYDEGLGLRTKDAVSPNLDRGQVLGSLAAFSLLYVMLLALWIFALNKKIQHGPELVPPPSGNEDIDEVAETIVSHRGSVSA